MHSSVSDVVPSQTVHGGPRIGSVMNAHTLHKRMSAGRLGSRPARDRDKDRASKEQRGALDGACELRSGGQAGAGVFAVVGWLAVVSAWAVDRPQDAIGDGQAGAGLGFEIVDAGFGDRFVVFV